MSLHVVNLWIRLENVRQESQTLSGHGESSCSKPMDKPWSGKPRVQDVS